MIEKRNVDASVGAAVQHFSNIVQTASIQTQDDKRSIFGAGPPREEVDPFPAG